MSGSAEADVAPLRDTELRRSARASLAPPLIPDVLVRQARLRPHDRYLTTIGATGEEHHLTFAEVEERSARLAVHLARRHGITPSSTVALAPANSAESVIAILALMRMGAVTLMLNPMDPPARQQELCDRARPELRLRDPGLPAERCADSIVIPDADEASHRDFVQPPIDRWSEVFLIGTSGSTAASKIVCQLHANAAANAADTVRHHGLAPGQTLLGCLPINHVNGLHFTLLATLTAGARAILLHQFDPFLYPKVLLREKPRIASVAPSLLDALTMVWRESELPASFAYFVSAAAPLSNETALSVRERIGARIVQSYGLTETTNFSCAMPTSLSDDDYHRLMIDAEIPPVGLPVTNEVAILDEAGHILSPGEIGEVSMRGPNVMGGYLNNPQANAEAFRSDWFRSGDLGYCMAGPGGEDLIVLTGRIKNIAKVRGETVSLDEVDRALRAVPGLSDGACVAVRHPLEGEVIVAAIVAQDSLSDATILQSLQQSLPAVALPRQLIRLPALPRTATGKIRRPQLSEEIAASCRSGLV